MIKDNDFIVINDLRQLGYMDINASMRLNFHIAVNLKGITATLSREDASYGRNSNGYLIVETHKLTPNTGSVFLVDRHFSMTVNTIYQLDETRNGIYLMVKIRAKNVFNGDSDVIVDEGYIINKFQLMIMRKRFEKAARVTIQDILDVMEKKHWYISKPFQLKNTTIVPYQRGIVRVINDANPDGMMLYQDGNCVTPDIFEVIAKMTEEEQDLFMINNFTTLKKGK